MQSSLPHGAHCALLQFCSRRAQRMRGHSGAPLPAAPALSWRLRVCQCRGVALAGPGPATAGAGASERGAAGGGVRCYATRIAAANTAAKALEGSGPRDLDRRRSTPHGGSMPHIGVACPKRDEPLPFKQVAQRGVGLGRGGRSQRSEQRGARARGAPREALQRHKARLARRPPQPPSPKGDTNIRMHVNLFLRPA
eukprot:scaffold23810_cov131-Isochrysis_galbana.AAC.5